jgi:hypothetical protein
MPTTTKPIIYVEGAPSPWWRPLARSDRWALAWLFIIPTLLFVLPALFGRPSIDADNVIQNFPLRVLAGQQLASGHLPLLNPLAFSGTPLLGGLNAGALYPLTLIFAFVPAIGAWLINMIVVYLTAAAGVYVLLRWHGLRTLPSFVAALSYTYSGAMIGQMVHFGVVQGFSFIPWAMVLMLALSRRLRWLSPDATARHLVRVALPWVCGVALLWGLTFLTGEPRAIVVIELLTIVVVPCVLLLRTSYWIFSWRARVTYLLTLLVGFVWGVGLGLVQLLPGWSFIHFSQRSAVTYHFFGNGSLAVRWAALLFSPDLFGGNGAFGQRGFFANYNLAEVTGYAGLLALMAAAAFLTRFTWKGWRGAERDYSIYFVLGVVGLFATWGSFTPLGHVFREIPLFGSTRLQSRNVILVDFALSIVLGWWLQHVRARDVQAGLEKGFRWITALPALLAGALSLLLLAWGPATVARFGVPAGTAHFVEGLKLVNWLHVVLALAAAAAVLIWRHSRHLLRILLWVFAVDLVVFLMFTSTGLIGGSGPREPPRAVARSLLGDTGRFALVDISGAHTGNYRGLGQPNMNVFTGLASVQGYGALISTIYDNATGTHPQAFLNACHLADGTFTQLRLSAVAISSTALSTNTDLSPTVSAGCVANKRTPSTRRYFGQLLKVHSIILTGVYAELLSKGPLHLQLLSGAGKPIGPELGASEASTKKAIFEWHRPSLAAGFVVTSASGVEVGSAVVNPYGDKPSYSLNTEFQLAISSTAWRLNSTQKKFSVFMAKTVLPPAWLDPSRSHGRVTHIRNAAWGDTWITVDLTSATVLDRSEAYLPGWRATAVNAATGRVDDLTVHRAGLIESVDVPKGVWTIHFHYHAPYIELSLAVSASSLVLLIAVASGFVLHNRRKRNAKVHS